MAESKRCWKPLKKALADRGWPATRLENGSIEPGTPDLIFLVKEQSPLEPGFAARELWAELKDAKVIVRKTTDSTIEIGLRKEQYIWLRENQEQGRQCFLLAKALGFWLLWDDQESWRLAKTVQSYSEMLKRAKFSVLKAETLLDKIRHYYL